MWQCVRVWDWSTKRKPRRNVNARWYNVEVPKAQGEDGALVLGRRNHVL